MQAVAEKARQIAEAAPPRAQEALRLADQKRAERQRIGDEGPVPFRQDLPGRRVPA